MKAVLIGLLLALASPLVAFAQCSGQAGANTYCGNNTGSTALPGWKSTSGIVSGAALTKADDTNITLTLGGTPTTALLQATSITAGWTGTLAAARLNSNVVQGVTNDTNVTGSIAAQNLTLGWTGELSLTRGGLAASLTASNGGIFYSTATAGAVLSGTATARLPLLSGASTAPVWGAFTLPASVTSGGVPYFSSTSVMTSSAALAANALVVGGGAGAAPATVTTGTGIITALGVNTGTAGAPAILIANGTSALGTSAISSATCATVVTTAATGAATTDVILAGFNGDPTAVTGYAPLTSGMLTIIAYPSTNNVNFKVCNNTGASITPGAITLNWRIAR